MQLIFRRARFTRLSNKYSVALRTMKLLLVLTTAACLQLSARGYSQTVTLQFSNTPLEKIFKEIKRQTGYRFIYVKDELKSAALVTVKLTNASVSDALNTCLHNQPLTWLMEDKYIVIKSQVPSPVKSIPVTIPLIEVRGRVIREDGEPVANATVRALQSGISTTTNNNGDFILSGIKENDRLAISSIEMQTLYIDIAGKSYLSLVAQQKVNTLEETIIKGYYNTTRKLNTGSVGKITTEQITNQPVSNPLAALQGRVPGLFIKQSNGLPGSDFQVLIRGRNSIEQGNQPLFIVDGVPFITDNLAQRSSLFASNPFNTINPKDIESIEVLKDADATAIYGSRGANGVVLITTRKGKEGSTHLEANFYKGWGRTTRTMDFMNTAQYVAMRKEAFGNDGVTPTLSNAPDLIAFDTTRYTDWKKLLIGNTAHTTSIGLRLSGGNTGTNFSLSSNYYRESTVFPTDKGLLRSDVLLNVNHTDANKRFNTSITASYTANINTLPQQDLTASIAIAPNAPFPYDSLGKLVWNEKGASFNNPLANLLKEYRYEQERISANITLRYKLVKQFYIKLNAGYNSLFYDEMATTPIASQNPASAPLGNSSFGKNNVHSWLLEPQFSYDYQLSAKTKLELLAGATWQENKNRSSLINGSGYTNDAQIKSVDAAPTKTASNDYAVYHYQAGFAKLTFNHDNKYILNLTGRRDGSSRFGPGRRFANFGALGVAWIFSKEKFIQENIPFLSFGKIRTSWGVTGNDQIGNYRYLDSWVPGSFPYLSQSVLSPARLFNPIYGWEKNTKVDIAIETAFLKDRIRININWFRNRSGNQLISYSLAGQTGFNSIIKNLNALVQNHGLEIEISSLNLKLKNWEWISSLNFTSSKNKLLRFPGLAASSYSNTYVINEPLNVVRGLHYTGLNPSTGVYSFLDVNNDGRYDFNDYSVLGTTNPAFYGGFDNRLTWRQFKLQLFFQFVKQDGLHMIYGSFARAGTLNANQPIDVLDRWRKAGDAYPYQKYSQASSGSAASMAALMPLSDEAFTDASFIRLKNLHVEYNLSQKLLSRLKLVAFTVYAEGQNLLTITNYKGADPENQSFIAMPPLKLFATGIRLTL